VLGVLSPKQFARVSYMSAKCKPYQTFGGRRAISVTSSIDSGRDYATLSYERCTCYKRLGSLAYAVRLTLVVLLYGR